MTATADLEPLTAELALWRQVGARAPLWWRDDDLVAPTPRLERLRREAERRGIPVLMSIIPAAMQDTLPAAVLRCPAIQLCQHGFSHTNHEPAGQPPAEFGPHRATDAALLDIERGQARLAGQFGDRLLPVFVAPWNALRPDIAPHLPRLGLTGLSGYGRQDPEQAAPDLVCVNAHVDILNWAEPRADGVPPASLHLTAERLVDALAALRQGTPQSGRAIGLLTHHRAMGDDAWESFCLLLDSLLASGAAQFRSPQELFRPEPDATAPGRAAAGESPGREGPVIPEQAKPPMRAEPFNTLAAQAELGAAAGATKLVTCPALNRAGARLALEREKNMLKVTPLGTCRITNPLRQFSEQGTLALNMSRIYGFVHTTSEILQQIDYIDESKTIPEPLIKFIGPNINHARCKDHHETSEVYFVEISSRKIFQCGEFLLQSNHLARQIRMALQDAAKAKNFLAYLVKGDEASCEALLASAGLNETAPVYQILRQVRVRTQTRAELAADMQLICNRLKGRVVFCTHVGAEPEPGKPLADRMALINDVKEIAKEHDFEVFDPTRMMVAFGQERAMDRDGKDLAHYTPQFESVLGDLFAAIAGVRLSNAPAITAKQDDETSRLQELASGIRGMSKNVSRMFLPLSEMNKAYLAEFYAEKPNKPLGDFLGYIQSEFSDEDYTEIQKSHLSHAALSFMKDQNWTSPEIKYLDFPFWAASKFAVARRLGLNTLPQQRILDIGAGPGHFGVVSNYYKHLYCGLDVPMRAVVPGTTAHVFDDLCCFFNLLKISQRIEAGVPLGLPYQFELIVCLMGTFNTIREGGKVIRPWNWAEWHFFLTDLVNNHAAPDARMYFQISRDYLPAEVWEKIERVASECNAASSVFMFDASLAERLKSNP